MFGFGRLLWMTHFLCDMILKLISSLSNEDGTRPNRIINVIAKSWTNGLL